MSGVLVPILKMTPFDFTFLGGGTSTHRVLHPALNVTSYYYGRLIVRVHAVDIVSGGGTIDVVAFGTDPSTEDTQEFGSGMTATFTARVDDSTVQGSFVSATASDLWPYLTVGVGVAQGASGGRLYAVLSADLLLREA